MSQNAAQSCNERAKSLIPLVYKIAAKIARRLPRHVALDDLVSAGMLGLAIALKRFDPSRADRFLGYAEYRIRGEILDELRRRDLLSRDARVASKKLQQTIQDLSARLGREAQSEEVAQRLGISLEYFNTLQQRLINKRSVSTEDLETELSQEGKDPYEETFLQETRAVLAQAIESLPKQQSLVLWLYYYEELPLKEIAEILGVTSSRVCQIRAEAVEKIRTLLLKSEKLAA